MKAITIPEPGGPEALVLSDVERPEPGPREVRVTVTAAGVNRADVMQRLGFYPPPQGESEIPGLEVSGVIESVGPDVNQWLPGDRVCALLSGGGYAEEVIVPQGQLLAVPGEVSLADAAALPEVVCTVWSNLVMTAGLTAGQSVLIHGGSSGIGTMAIQIARSLGAQVMVTAGSAEKLQACKDLGADVLINYRDEDFVEQVKQATEGRGVDVILDNMGAKYLPRNVEALATGGRLVVIGLQGGAQGELDLRVLLRKRASVQATSLRARSREEKEQIVTAVREHVWPLIINGTIRPVIHSRHALEAAEQAHRELESSSHIGKILLTP